MPTPKIMDRSASFSPRAIGAAVPDLLLGLVFLVAWIDPDRLGGAPVGPLVLTMLIEFIVVHSSGFMGTVMVGDLPRERKLASLLGLIAFYTLFVAGFAVAFKTWWPLASFWGLMFNRLLSVLFGQAPTGDERSFAQRSWAVGALLYLGFAFVTVLLPLPRLGMTPMTVSAQQLPGSGLWVSQPWRVLAFGFLYFTATGISELVDHRWVRGGIPERRSVAA